jgi:hypothetical protein
MMRPQKLILSRLQLTDYAPLSLRAHVRLCAEYEAHGRLAKKMEAMGCTSYLATGEHEYTRWGYVVQTSFFPSVIRTC